MKTICVRLSRDFDHQLRVWAAEMDMSRSDLIREALQEKMDRLDQGDVTMEWGKSQKGDQEGVQISD